MFGYESGLVTLNERLEASKMRLIEWRKATDRHAHAMDRDRMIAPDEAQRMMGRTACAHIILGMNLEERALAALPPEFRAAIVMADIEGMALPQVAGALGVPVGTVKSRLFRARRILAKELGNQNP